MAQLAEAARIKRPPRHAFCAERAITALWQELASFSASSWFGPPTPMYQAGSTDVAVIAVRPGFSVWCCKGKFMWQDAMYGTITHPAHDPAGAAARMGGTDAHAFAALATA